MAGIEFVRAPYGHVRLDAEGGLVREVSLRRGAAPDRGASRLAADLRRYLAGERVNFSSYKIDFSGYTPFERAVLEATRRIPDGETRTYGDIARAIGKPGAARAVGQALGKNRTCIVIPCHRVVGSNGLGGFSGGLDWKRAFLKLEGTPDPGR